MAASPFIATPPRTSQQRPCPIADLQRQALAMLASGYSVIPLYDKLPYDPKKRPYQDKSGAWVVRPRLAWDRYKREQPTQEQVNQWFDPAQPLDRQPNGIGLLCGKVSGGVCCLDFETVETFMAWKAQADPALYSQMCIVRTGRGYHALFTCDMPRTGEAPDVEVRGESLYIAAVNSWHPTAHRRYTLEQGSVCTLPHIAQAEADRLITLAIPTFTLQTPRGPATAPTAPTAPTPKPKQAHRDNLTAADVRIAFNARYDLRDLIVEYGGRLQHGRGYHCPYHAAHANGDRNGSLLVSQSKKPDRYGPYICSCYNSACPLHTGPGKVIAPFDLMQIMEGLDPKQAVFTAVKRLGIGRTTSLASPHTETVPIGRPPKLTALDYRTKAAQLADGSDEHGNPRVLLSVAELAATFAISHSTAQRYEKWLRVRLLWDRQQIGQYQSVATVLPGVAKSRGVKSPENNVFRGVKSPEKVCSQNAPDSASQSDKTAFDEITHIACNSVPAVAEAPVSPIPPVVAAVVADPGTPAPAPTKQLHASPPKPLLPEQIKRVREALQAFGGNTKGKRIKTTLVEWVSSYMAADNFEIDVKLLITLIAQERLAALTLAGLAKRDRYYQKRGFRHEQRKIATEYAKRGIDPATLTTRKRAPKLKTDALPLVDTPQEMPVKATVSHQDVPKVQNTEPTTPSLEMPAIEPNGWRDVLGQKGLDISSEREPAMSAADLKQAQRVENLIQLHDYERANGAVDTIRDRDIRDKLKAKIPQGIMQVAA